MINSSETSFVKIRGFVSGTGDALVVLTWNKWTGSNWPVDAHLDKVSSSFGLHTTCLNHSAEDLRYTYVF